MVSVDAGFRRAGRPQHDAGAVRAGVVASTELDARRLVDLLKRGGVSSVVHSGATTDASASRAVDVVVASGGRGLEADEAAVEALLVPLADVPVVLVGSSLRRRGIDRALEMGVRGYVAEVHVEERLVATVQAVAAGQLAIPWEGHAAIERPLLSPREKQILSMVVLGFTNQEIANKLFVAETTVKSHLSSAYRKLHVRSRHEATSVILDADRGFGLGILSISEEPIRAAS
jgi:DNA-binding NarL/FixJ family response regulator